MEARRRLMPFPLFTRSLLPMASEARRLVPFPFVAHRLVPIVSETRRLLPMAFVVRRVVRFVRVRAMTICAMSDVAVMDSIV